MLETLLTKENVALGLASALLVWRIIDVIVRQRKRREHELERLAFDITRVVVGEDNLERENFFSHYMMYLNALERDMTPHTQEGRERMVEFLEWVHKHLERMEMMSKALDGVDEKLKSGYQVTVSDLFHRNLTWGHWWEETKMLMMRTLKKIFRKKFHPMI